MEKILWRRKWQPTPLFLPGKYHGCRSLVGYTVHGVAKSWTKLSDFNLLSLLHCCCCCCFNFILFLNFTILYWFCQISKWIRHRYTCVPHPEPSSLPIPSHLITIVLCVYNFYKHWETKKCVTPFDICFIPVVWNWTWNICAVCLVQKEWRKQKNQH